MTVISILVIVMVMAMRTMTNPGAFQERNYDGYDKMENTRFTEFEERKRLVSLRRSIQLPNYYTAVRDHETLPNKFVFNIVVRIL